MDDFADMNLAWEDWISPEQAPARATVQALMASPDLLVEMTVVAACV
jgi:enamine deaminase RidA (YjgF/YER057c/UK114 family)